MASKTASLGNKQLALAIQPNDQMTLANFCWGTNTLLQQQINALLSTKSEKILYLWSNIPTGKSHLLQACCQAFKDQAMYLPLKAFSIWGSESIVDLDTQTLICIDDIQAIAGDTAFERALFHLYNRIRDTDQGLLILSGNHAPINMPLSLPDLRSRLGAGLVFHLQDLSDEEKIKVLQQQALQRGFELSKAVAQFLLTRCTRDMHYLYKLLNLLDEASLAAHRKITIPFVKEVLKGKL